MTSTVSWNDFPANKPAAIYARGQTETRVFYFVALPRKQVLVLQWHTSTLNRIAQWEWPGGKKFNGEVIRWASEPSAP